MRVAVLLWARGAHRAHPRRPFRQCRLPGRRPPRCAAVGWCCLWPQRFRHGAGRDRHTEL